MSVYEKSLEMHEQFHGKLRVDSKINVDSLDDLSLVYTPGVAGVCKAIVKEPTSVYKYTIKSNTVAVITNGTAVLGLGNIGPAAALPVMEGKCVIFKRFAGIDAFPICIDEKNTDRFVEIVKSLTTTFGGINLEDIKAPECFEIEARLKEELDIPVFHDDQHGTAIVALAALINALKVVEKDFANSKVVISGAGAAGTSVVRLLVKYGCENIIACDSKGIIQLDRDDILNNEGKKWIAKNTNKVGVKGALCDAMKDADVFIGVSAPGIVTKEMVSSMNNSSIVFALANPEPEILPNDAISAGALIVGTGRSDYGNQINNALAFPGIFRAALDAGIRKFTDEMFIAAAQALADFVETPDKDNIVPSLFDHGVMDTVASSIKALMHKS